MPHHHAGHQHIHKAPVEKRQNAETVVQYVYKTAAKTFDGPVGGYSTVNPPAAQATPQQQSNQGSGNSGNNGNSNSNSNSNSNQQAQQQQQQQQQAAAQSAAAASSQQAAAAQSAAAASSKAAQQQAASASASSQAAPSLAQSSSSAASSSQQISSQSSKSQTSVAVQSALNTPTSSSPSVAATTSAVSSPSSEPSSGGLSSGGKAGIAIVVILLVGLLAGLAFFFVRRKQRRDSKTDATYEKTDDEKSAYAAGLARSQSVTSTKTSATAPRLSIRPITQFLPDLAARGKAANAVAGAGLHDSSIASQAAMARSHENEKVNPFGDHAQAQAPNRMSDQATLPIQNNAVENPFGNHAEVAPADATPAADMPAPLRTKTPTPEGVPAGIAAGAVAGAAGAVGVAALAHKDHDKQAPRDRSSSPRSVSPTASEFSTTPSSPMANGAAPTNVHRVQLDFKPSMDDELALRAGDLVRLLHEYDDGWALCIRLDRSQQGVTPRTCLSARPVKPRPRGPPRGPGPRGPPPPGMRGPPRSASPASGRGSPGPYGPGPNGRVPRPMGPGPMGPPNGPPRSMSPGPYGGGPRSPQPHPAAKRRSNSASDVRDRRMSPPGPSPMNPGMQKMSLQQQAVAPPSGRMTPTRKPVPGQAM